MKFALFCNVFTRLALSTTQLCICSCRLFKSPPRKTRLPTRLTCITHMVNHWSTVSIFPIHIADCYNFQSIICRLSSCLSFALRSVLDRFLSGNLHQIGILTLLDVLLLYRRNKSIVRHTRIQFDNKSPQSYRRHATNSSSPLDHDDDDDDYGKEREEDVRFFSMILFVIATIGVDLFLERYTDRAKERGGEGERK